MLHGAISSACGPRYPTRSAHELRFSFTIPQVLLYDPYWLYQEGSRYVGLARGFPANLGTATGRDFVPPLEVEWCGGSLLQDGGPDAGHGAQPHCTEYFVDSGGHAERLDREGPGPQC